MNLVLMLATFLDIPKSPSYIALGSQHNQVDQHRQFERLFHLGFTSIFYTQ